MLAVELDHARSTMLLTRRRGLWRWLPGEAGESAVMEQAMRQAQQQIHEAALAETHIAAAQRQAHQALAPLAARHGLDLVIHWQPPVTKASP